jgi:hypothetical protein
VEGLLPIKAVCPEAAAAIRERAWVIPMRFQTSDILFLVGQASCLSISGRRDACAAILGQSLSPVLFAHWYNTSESRTSICGDEELRRLNPSTGGYNGPKGFPQDGCGWRGRA